MFPTTLTWLLFSIELTLSNVCYALYDLSCVNTPQNPQQQAKRNNFLWSWNESGICVWGGAHFPFQWPKWPTSEPIILISQNKLVNFNGNIRDWCNDVMHWSLGWTEWRADYTRAFKKKKIQRKKEKDQIRIQPKNHSTRMLKSPVNNFVQQCPRV